MKELTDEQVESVSEEVRDAMRACCPYPKPLHKKPQLNPQLNQSEPIAA